MTELAYFEHLYRSDPDPWRLEGAPYEHRKRALTVASLPRERYFRGFEPACSTGLLTTMLAERCDSLLATDPVQVAVEGVRARGLPGVTTARGSLPDDWPDGPLDLVVLSEILYFLDDTGRRRVTEQLLDRLSDDGHVVAVHWRHDFDESASAPEEAHRDLHVPCLVPIVSHVEDDFRLEVLRRA